VQVIQGFESCFIALFRPLNNFCFVDALFLVGQVAFSGRYSLGCGFELFSLYKFAEEQPKGARPCLFIQNTKKCSARGFRLRLQDSP
jgi:hypothetical protein